MKKISEFIENIVANDLLEVFSGEDLVYTIEGNDDSEKCLLANIVARNYARKGLSVSIDGDGQGALLADVLIVKNGSLEMLKRRVEMKKKTVIVSESEIYGIPSRRVICE